MRDRQHILRLYDLRRWNNSINSTRIIPAAAAQPTYPNHSTTHPFHTAGPGDHHLYAPVLYRTYSITASPLDLLQQPAAQLATNLP